jgi:predicted transcriptional regulator
VKYISRTEITCNILNAANGGANKTKIMYNAFLSHGILKEYISFLIEKNLLEYIEGSRIFKTTEKGLNYLKIHNEIDELLKIKIGNDELN